MPIFTLLRSISWVQRIFSKAPTFWAERIGNVHGWNFMNSVVNLVVVGVCLNVSFNSLATGPTVLQKTENHQTLTKVTTQKKFRTRNYIAKVRQNFEPALQTP